MAMQFMLKKHADRESSNDSRRTRDAVRTRARRVRVYTVQAPETTAALHGVRV